MQNSLNPEIQCIYSLRFIQESAGHDAEKEKKEARKSKPHLYNLNMDSQLSGMIVYILDQSLYNIGNNKADHTPDIILNGLRFVSITVFTMII